MHPHEDGDIIVSDADFLGTSPVMEFVTELVHFTTAYFAEEHERLQIETRRLDGKAEEARLQSEKLREKHSFFVRLRQELLEHKTFVHAIVVQTGDKATGRLVKEPPAADHPAVMENIQVVVLPGSDKTTFILRTPDAPWLEEL
jgi:hypothetical protein